MTAPVRLKRALLLLLEMGGTLFLVLALYWLFLWLLYAMFPSGTPLRDLLESSSESEPTFGRNAEATLSEVRRDVRFRRGNSIAWSGASEGMQLYSQDAVQTLDRAGATISFGNRDHLTVGSNSLVVVTRLNAKDEAGPRSFRVHVEGELRGNLSATRNLKLELAAAGHLARLKPGAARFRVTPNNDNSASLAVYAGELQILDGKGVRVPANHGITLRQGVAVGPVLPLPAAPQLLGPQPALYRYRLLPPPVRLAWAGAPGEYRVQIAKTPRFERPLMDEKIVATEYRTAKLDQGSYYWRVCRLEEGREGAFSSTGRCQLQQLLTPPGLAVQFPPERAPAGPYTLSGQVEPGSRIFVDGMEVTVQQSGRFIHQGMLKPGVNLIRVEALDTAGNASYASRIVYGNGQAAEAATRTQGGDGACKPN